MLKLIASFVLRTTKPLILLPGLILITAATASAMGGGGMGGNGHHMKGIGGSAVGTGSIDCNGSACTAKVSGNFLGMGITNGSLGATLNFSNANPIDNGSGGSCFGASGTIVLTARSGATQTLGAAGLLCELGSSQTPATFTGSYMAESGTGTFSNRAGIGSATLGIDDSGNAYINLSGAMGTMSGGHMH